MSMQTSTHNTKTQLARKIEKYVYYGYEQMETGLG